MDAVTRPPVRGRNAVAHARAVTYAVRAFRRLGCRVERTTDRAVELLVDGQPVAIRASAVLRKRVVVRHPAKTYHYEVRAYSWNLHAHGRRTAQPAWWVLATLDCLARSFVVPAAVVGRTRTTWSLAAYPRRPQSGLHAWRGRWDAAGARRAA